MSAVGKPKSDLGVRAVSGVVMIAVAALTLFVGGFVLAALLVIVAGVASAELARISRKLPWSPIARTATLVLGVGYIAVAAATLVMFRQNGVSYASFPVMVAIATDIGAYFAGRSIGGPKIAPAISPSKTWAGLAGGMMVAGLAAVLWAFAAPQHGPITAGTSVQLFGFGAILAIVAQAGDFGESFLKRKAGVKDSGTIIPGHGGVLDRIDGLLAVLFVCGIPAMLALITMMLGGDVLPTPA